MMGPTGRCIENKADHSELRGEGVLKKRDRIGEDLHGQG
jgi:hypothetical protein